MTFAISHDHIGLSVVADDLDATIDWYARHLGLAVEQRYETHGFAFVFLARGEVRIELMAGGAQSRQTPTESVFTSLDPSRLHHFCLAVANLDEAVAALAAQGVGLIGGPMEVPEAGQRIAFVADNLGNIIELTEPGTGTRR
ncbi:VOC family protein [Streptomyces sp. 6N223]|uniref:VOC family protein n=1 Tax=Streptomyces sp. 6N223 TaxID=3457412 RepID=UPI003FD13D69